MDDVNDLKSKFPFVKEVHLSISPYLPTVTKVFDSTCFITTFNLLHLDAVRNLITNLHYICYDVL